MDNEEKYLSPNARRVLKYLHKEYRLRLPILKSKPTVFDFQIDKATGIKGETLESVGAELTKLGLAEPSRSRLTDDPKDAPERSLLTITPKGIDAVERMQDKKRSVAFYLLDKIVTVIVVTLLSAWLVTTCIERPGQRSSSLERACPANRVDLGASDSWWAMPTLPP